MGADYLLRNFQILTALVRKAEKVPDMRLTPHRSVKRNIDNKTGAGGKRCTN